MFVYLLNLCPPLPYLNVIDILGVLVFVVVFNFCICSCNGLVFVLVFIFVSWLLIFDIFDERTWTQWRTMWCLGYLAQELQLYVLQNTICL